MLGRGKKIQIEPNDVDVAIQRISKKKAIGCDYLALTPLEGGAPINILKNNLTYEETKEIKEYKISKRDWTIDIKWNISINLAKYYNYCLQNENSLLHDHNIARQIFIQKEQSEF